MSLWAKSQLVKAEFLLLAIDLGLKRIGVAFSPDGKLALPLNAVMRINRNQAASEIKALISEYRANGLIVGIPIGGESEDEMRRRADHFIKLLELDSTTKVYFQDEAGSSLEAMTLGSRSTTRKKDGKLDSLAALVILQRFLDRKKDE